MTARQWTREELDRVHPLPQGWAWRLWDGEPMACSGSLEIFADGDEVWGQGRESNMTALPTAVCLAVILAGKGMDSLGAMAAHYEGKLERRPVGSPNVLTVAWSEFAAMLRRGRVQP